MESSHNQFSKLLFKPVTYLVAGAILFSFALALFLAPAVAFAGMQLPQQSAPGRNNSLGLIDFGVKETKSKQVKIYWDTGTENRIAGFNVWKRTANGKPVRLNTRVIGAKAWTVSGNSYNLVDKKVKLKGKYKYQLEVISVDGYSTWMDEITLKVR